MLYDGDCPLCMREVNMLKRRDKEAGKIDFVDISSPQYDPAANANISYKQVCCVTQTCFMHKVVKLHPMSNVKSQNPPSSVSCTS